MKKFMLLLVAVFALFLYACKPQVEIYINLNVEEIEIDEGKEFLVEFETNAIETLEWESMDPSVATVEDGLIKAVNDGFTEIIVRSGDVEKTIFVTVNKVKFVPSYVTLTIDGDPVQVMKFSNLAANLREYFNGETHLVYDDALFKGWFLDEALTQECNIDVEITEDISIYSKFEWIEINCELRVEFDQVVGRNVKFDETLDVQSINPTYATYFDLTSDLLSKFTFIEVKYDISKEDYFVTQILSEASQYKIPSNGFLVAINKECESHDEYIKYLVVGEKITLSTYSALTAKALYVNEVMEEFVNDFELIAPITTRYCTVYDVRNKQVLYSKAGDTRAWPASTTKIITAIAALKYANLDDKVTIGDELDICYEGSSPSVCGLKKGEVWTLEQLIYGLLLPSGNDAGYGIAALTINSIYPDNTYTGKEKVEMFAELMNEVARDCGAVNSKFYTPDGNSYYNSDGTYQERTENHYVTADDMVRIAVYAFSFPAICQIVRTASITVKLETGQSKTFSLTNQLVKQTHANYYQGTVGLKTGTTNRAGACLISGVERARKFIIVASLNNPTSAERYTNTLTIFRSIFK